MKTQIQAALFSAVLPCAACAQDFNEGAANAPDQVPAFGGQTRAAMLPSVELKREVLADGLSEPWGMDQLPDGSWLVTEKAGQMRLVSAEGMISDPISGIPEVDAGGQGGLLDVSIGPGFAQDRRVWWSYAEPREGGRNATAVATGTLSADARRLSDVRAPEACLELAQSLRLASRLRSRWRSLRHHGREVSA